MYIQMPEIPLYDSKHTEKIKCTVIEGIYPMENSDMICDIYR